MSLLYNILKTKLPTASFLPGSHITGAKAPTGEARSTIGGLLKGAAIAGGITAAVGLAAINPVATLSITKSLIPKSLIGKVAAVGGAIVATSAVVQNPAIVGKSVKVAGKTGGALADLGTSIGKVSGGENILQTGKEFITEHPVFSGAAAALGLAAVGKAAIPAVAAYSYNQQTEAVKEQTAAIIAGQGIQPLTETSQNGQATTITPTNPTTPETTYMSDKPKTARKKTRYKTRREEINQRVNLIVSQNNKNYSVSRKSERYLNPIAQLN